MTPPDSYAVIVLAAGGSTRLGRPKQLLEFEGQTLIRRAALAALDSGAEEVVVVVGSQGQIVRREVSGLMVCVVHNFLWSEGMGGSIRVGLEALSTEAECVVITLCDQPHMTAAHIRTLAERCLNSNAPIVASSYAGVTGAPCAFRKDLFPQLRTLRSDSGAREWILNSGLPVATVEFPSAHIDVDTAEDYRSLVESSPSRTPIAKGCSD